MEQRTTAQTDEMNALTTRVIGAAIEVHRHGGPGLLESAYEACLYHELDSMSIAVERQRPLPISYKGIDLGCGYRFDLVVENRLLIELKSVEVLTPLHMAQVLTYLRLADLRLGLLINFNVAKLASGVKRVANQLSDSSAPSAPLR